MEMKKNPNVDLTRKTSFFFSIALLITMSIVLTAFELKQHEAKISDLVQSHIDPFELDDVPPTEILPPPPPAPPAPVIVEIQDDKKIIDQITIINVETPAEAPLAPIVITPMEGPEEVTDEPFISPESPASFDGGYAAFYKYVSSKVVYPAQARRDRKSVV